jgi:hypothetical protein
MARPKRMSARIAFYIPPGVTETVAEIKRLRTERHGGLEAREADIYREAVVRGLPLVLAAERGELLPPAASVGGATGGVPPTDGLRVPGKRHPVRFEDLGATMAHYRKSNRLTPAKAGALLSPAMQADDWLAIEEGRRRPRKKEGDQLVELLFPGDE